MKGVSSRIIRLLFQVFVNSCPGNGVVLAKGGNFATTSVQGEFVKRAGISTKTQFLRGGMASAIPNSKRRPERGAARREDEDATHSQVNQI